MKRLIARTIGLLAFASIGVSSGTAFAYGMGSGRSTSDEPKADVAVPSDMSESDILLDEPAAGKIQARQPKGPAPWHDMIHILPIAGASSYERKEGTDLKNLDEGYTAGALVNLGKGYVTLETGLTFTSTDVNIPDTDRKETVDFWALPLVAKVNFTGNPRQTVFVKAGFIPITADTSTSSFFDDIDLMGQIGLGGAIPVAPYVSLVLDASYNQLMSRESIKTDYSGYSLMAGVSFTL